MARKPRKDGFPTREQILAFIASSDQAAGKREIGKAFGLKGEEKIALKRLLRDMGDEGLIDAGPGRAFHKMGGVPKVTVLRIVHIDDAVQAFGGAGVSQDTPLAHSWAGIRTLRLADGPDEVHNRSIARIEFGKHAVVA